MKYKVIEWVPGKWWLVLDSGTTENPLYSPITQLYPEQPTTEPTWANQCFAAAQMVANQGLEALRNPHAMTGRVCGCNDCFCCAAYQIYVTVREFETKLAEVSR